MKLLRLLTLALTLSACAGFSALPSKSRALRSPLRRNAPTALNSAPELISAAASFDASLLPSTIITAALPTLQAPSEGDVAGFLLNPITAGVLLVLVPAGALPVLAFVSLNSNKIFGNPSE